MCEYCIFTMDWTSRISYVHMTILLGHTTTKSHSIEDGYVVHSNGQLAIA